MELTIWSDDDGRKGDGCDDGKAFLRRQLNKSRSGYGWNAG